jgi:membrane protease YdiL (CAAX protease family)
VPRPDPQRRDPLQPALGAGVCWLLYRVFLFLLVPIVQFFGGEMMAVTVPQLLAAGVASAIAMAIFESRPLLETGLGWQKGWLRNLLTGMVLAAGSACAVVLTAVVSGMASFRIIPNADISFGAALFTPLLLFCGAAGEEIAFRGFMLQYLVRGYGAWLIVPGMGILFGLLHADNPGATPLGVANTVGFGILFGVALLRTHDLWLPIGLHFGWNVALPFLGVELSGLTIRVTGYELSWKAGALWSGGKYGPEASILTTGVLLLLSVAVWRIPMARGWAYLLEPVSESGPSAA